MFSLVPAGSLKGVGEETARISRHGPGPGSRRFQLGGIVVRHAGSTCGGDTTLALYRLQVVAVEEGLFVPQVTSRGSN